MLGIEIIDAAFLPAALVAVLAGVLSFASPCVLPIVPPYMAYMSGMSVGEMVEVDTARKRALSRSLFFVLGLSVVFLLLGLTAAALGGLFIRNQVLFGRIAGIVIIIFGLHFLGIVPLKVLNREFRFRTGGNHASMTGAFILGLAFAFGWTPCIGPQLGAILSLAAQEESVPRGGVLLLFYAAGLGLPFIATAYFLNRFMGLFELMKTRMRTVEICMGVMLIAIGLLMVTNRFSLIAYWLLEKFPALALFG